MKDQQLKLTGSLSKIRVLPGLPQRILVSLAKFRPSDLLQSSVRFIERSGVRVVQELQLPRNFCISDPEAKRDVLLIQAVDAWGNQLRDLKHYEAVIESSASESKLQASFSSKGDAFIFLASGSREDNKIFVADGSAMGIGELEHNFFASVCICFIFFLVFVFALEFVHDCSGMR